MELRHHPGLRFGGVKSWPPLWTCVKRTDERATLRGEIGILATAYTPRSNATICFAVMEHESETYVGAILLEDAALCNQLCLILKANAGRPIYEIGNLDVSHLL